MARLGVSSVEAAKTMARWAEQGWLRRVRRGLYLAVPVDAEQPGLWSEDPLVLASVVWDPCYMTGWTAGAYWSLTEQVFQTVVVRTANRVRDPNQKLLDHRYLVGRVAPKRLTWGIKKIWFRDKRVGMADEAKVIIDVLDDPSIGGGIRHCADMLATYLVQHGGTELVRYGEMLGNGAVFKRLGFLCEHLQLAGPSFLDDCERHLTAGYATLDPGAEPGKRRNTRWRIVANVRFEGRSES